MIRIRNVTAATVACLLTACAAAQGEREMNYLGSALTKLSAAVDATIKYDKPALDLDDARLLQMSVAHDPSLLQPFERLTVRIHRQGEASAVLVCEANHGKALLEDAGCTASMDSHRWQTESVCEFTLKLTPLCVQ